MNVVSNTIYTRTGDTGTSGLIGNQRRSKTDPIFEAIGTIDEVNAQLGWCLTLTKQSELAKALSAIQSDLFLIGASIADTDQELPPIATTRTAELERQIDAWWAAAPPLTRFILPGGHPLAAALHVTRTTARRAERTLTHLASEQMVDPDTLIYINRLSDYLFAAARVVNARHGVREQPWIARHEA